MKRNNLFKPACNSWVAWDLWYLWYYEIDYKKLNENNFKKLKKVIVVKIPYEKLWVLYETCYKYFNDEATVVLACKISDLFE